MHRASLRAETDVEGWLDQAGRFLAAGVAPDQIVWSVGLAEADLFSGAVETKPEASAPPGAPDPEFTKLLRQAALHRDPERFALLYRVLVRSRREPGLLRRSTDSDMSRLLRMAKAVKRDIHKMHAFVRFRQVPEAAAEQFVAWFEPEHFIEEAAAPFFARRFAAMRWSILTPRRSVHWTGSELVFGAGRNRGEVPDGDALDDLWRTYYAHIFNPARLKVQAMRAEMPRKYWHNLPEARLIAPLIARAGERTGRMVEAGATAPAPHAEAARRQAAASLPPAPSSASLQGCSRCPIGRLATQAVPGEGPADARIMIIGEQPGDREDLTGRPFVGPAGQLLDRALAEAGLHRPDLYLTNAVKHFKFEPRGKRRIHKRPGVSEIQACAVWLRGEIEERDPAVIVALGATAAFALLGRQVPINEVRGRFLPLSARARLMVSVHPAYILRLLEADRERAMGLLVADLRQVARQAAPDDRVEAA